MRTCDSSKQISAAREMPETEGKKNRRIRIKIISMGAAECGKSCLIKRYCEKRFVSKYMSTLGIDFGVTKFKCSDVDVNVNIFDMSGQPFFYEVRVGVSGQDGVSKLACFLVNKEATKSDFWYKVRNEFYKDVQGAILVYDVNCRSSFDGLSEWLVEMRSHLPRASDIDDVIFVVCANKTDVGRREVTESEGRLWAETKRFLYFETSAQTGQNVVEMFEMLFTAVVAMATEGKKPSGVTFDLKYTPEQVALVTRIRSCEDNHEILGLSKGCSREEINKSYRQLAILLHPDKNQAPGSGEAFKALARAREELLTNR